MANSNYIHCETCNKALYLKERSATAEKKFIKHDDKMFSSVSCLVKYIEIKGV